MNTYDCLCLGRCTIEIPSWTFSDSSIHDLPGGASGQVQCRFRSNLIKTVTCISGKISLNSHCEPGNK